MGAGPVTEYDDATVAMRGLFELACGLLVRGVVAVGAGLGFAWLVSKAVPSEHQGPWLLALTIAVALGVGIATAMLLDDASGATRKRVFDGYVRRYAYPITLVAGVLAGVLYADYAASISNTGSAEDAAVQACLRMPRCILMANRALGDDVRHSLPLRQ